MKVKIINKMARLKTTSLSLSLSLSLSKSYYSHQIETSSQILEKSNIHSAKKLKIFNALVRICIQKKLLSNLQKKLHKEDKNLLFETSAFSEWIVRATLAYVSLYHQLKLKRKLVPKYLKELCKLQETTRILNRKKASKMQKKNLHVQGNLIALSDILNKKFKNYYLKNNENLEPITKRLIKNLIEKFRRCQRFNVISHFLFYDESKRFIPITLVQSSELRTKNDNNLFENLNQFGFKNKFLREEVTSFLFSQGKQTFSKGSYNE